jgi:hypothetical protein
VKYGMAVASFHPCTGRSITNSVWGRHARPPQRLRPGGGIEAAGAGARHEKACRLANDHPAANQLIGVITESKRIGVELFMGGPIMSRMTISITTLLVVLLALVSFLRATSLNAVAEEGTPTVTEEPAGGLRFEPLAFGMAEALPIAPAKFSLLRATMDPGVILPIEAEDPSVSLIYIEAGALTFKVAAPIVVMRGAAGNANGGLDPEEVGPGVDVVVEAGDSVLLPENVSGEIRNDSTVSAVALAALVEPMPVENAGSPAS